jgi:hypothetical protein
MIDKKRLMEWLETLPEDSAISIDDGGLELVCDLEPDAYLEVGGVPEDVVDLMCSYIDIRFKDPVQPHDVDLGSLLITHVSGRSWILDVDSSWGADDPSYRGCHAVKDLETFPKGEEYPYDLTQADIDSREIRATLFVGGEVEHDVISITYDLVDSDGNIIAAGLVAVKEGA